jgi:hypothetical protein
MTEQKHIINRHVLELKVPEHGRAQHIQNLTSEIVRKKLLPALDKLFSGISGKNEIIRIDKLEIDLGFISENELENEFVNRIINEIEPKIIKHMISVSKTANVNLFRGKNVADISEHTPDTKSKNFLEQFIYFLKTGHLPWWQSTAGADLTVYIFKEALNVENKVFNNEVIPLLRKPEIRQRLFYQLNHSQHHAFLKKLNEKLLESYTGLFQVLYSFFNSGVDKKILTEGFYSVSFLYFSMELELSSNELKTGFFRQILDFVLAGIPSNEKETFLLKILNSEQIKQQKSQPKETILVLSAVIQSVAELPSYSEILKGAVQNLSVKNEPALFDAVDKFFAKTKYKIASKTDKNTGQTALPGEKKSLFSEQKNVDEITEKPFSPFQLNKIIGEDQIVVFNAGLILVHPFLRYFFEGLNLLDNELKFRSMADAFKAVHLLQFITNEQELTEEIELPLNKILCGLDIYEPVPKNVYLTEEEKEECVFLIKTVLERWDALKTTNPAALRETYLQREGILKRSGQSWTLVIERNTFDIMLEKLPWTLSLIKLPWCEQILNVEW